ncbi:MAG: AraC family transcriptional regulator [Pseudomonadales bacterium]|nr:AraC family transcriptional regulator [Pseudomonadales bacterium]
MGQITSLFAHKVAGIVEDSIERSALLAWIGIDPDAPVDPSVMVSDSDYYDFLEKIARAEQAGHTLGLRAGNSMRCDDYGAFGLAWKSASTLRGSLNRAERYSRVLTSVASNTMEPTKGGAFAHLNREGERRLGSRLSNEATIASMFTIGQEVIEEPMNLLGVYFKHSAPAVIADHEEFFGCPVHFDTDRDALLISQESLDTSTKLGDPGIARFFDTHLEAELAQFDDDSALDKRVKIQISQALSEGVPNISDIASNLAMSGRSLQRKLSEHGQSFQSLVDDARRELAERLLANSNHSLADIAFLTGFSEQSSFNRAFKRWAGQTPRSFRLSIQAE